MAGLRHFFAGPPRPPVLGLSLRCFSSRIGTGVREGYLRDLRHVAENGLLFLRGSPARSILVIGWHRHDRVVGPVRLAIAAHRIVGDFLVRGKEFEVARKVDRVMPVRATDGSWPVVCSAQLELSVAGRAKCDRCRTLPAYDAPVDRLFCHASSL